MKKKYIVELEFNDFEVSFRSDSFVKENNKITHFDENKKVTTIEYVNEAGEYHRLDGPALQINFGIDSKLIHSRQEFWFVNNKLHREDGPAVFYDDMEYWFLNGNIHREGGPAIKYNDGTKEWYQNGKLHRIDGPAFEDSNGSKYWYYNGKFHKVKK